MALIKTVVAGKTVLIDSSTIGGANVVLQNVTCDASVAVGNAVRMNSGGTAINALADSTANANVIGVVESKSTSVLCNIRVLGVTEGAIFAGLDVTKKYFLSDAVAGTMVTTPPTASGSVILKIGQPFSATALLVLVGEGIVRA